MPKWLSGVVVALAVAAALIIGSKPPKPEPLDDEIVKVRLCVTVWCPMVERGEIPLWLAQSYGCHCDGSDGTGKTCARSNWLGLRRTGNFTVIGSHR